jgi:hypothetical protein
MLERADRRVELSRQASEQFILKHLDLYQCLQQMADFFKGAFAFIIVAHNFQDVVSLLNIFSDVFTGIAGVSFVGLSACFSPAQNVVPSLQAKSGKVGWF